MLGLLHNLILVLVSLYILLSAPFSALSVVLTFSFLRSFVRPYNTTADPPLASPSSPTTGNARGPTTLTWTEFFLLVPCTFVALCFAFLLRRALPQIVIYAERSPIFDTTKRFVRRIMGYDPAKPSTWSIAQLRVYATEHNITIPSGCEKSELVALVDECLTNALLADHIRKEHAVDDAVLSDLLAASPEDMLRHTPYPIYAAPLRRHPQTLQRLIDAGLRQLESLSFVARLCSAQLPTPLGTWLAQVAVADDGGASFQAALTPADGAAAASTVCGRFCGDGDMVVRCLDCGADPTCVMCMDCFRHSPCVNHRYRITQGSGGGMCDCGDPTAWKPESFCSRHRASAAPCNNVGGEEPEQTSGRDPVDTLAEEDREWVVVLLRGVVQYISLVILQSLRIAQAQKRAKALEKKKKQEAAAPATDESGSKSKTKAGPTTAAAPKDPEATLMEDVALIADAHDWLSGWLAPVANSLWSLMSTTEVAKQIVAQLWSEPLRLSTAPAVSLHRDEESVPSSAESAPQKDTILSALPDNFMCMHPVFLFETLRPVTDRERPVKRTAPEPWREVLAKCIGHCLSVAKLRLPVGALMAAYAEWINSSDTSAERHNSLHEYQVQVLTNPDVLHHLMTPSNMPYRNATNTVVHRVLSSIFYTVCVGIDQGPRNPILRTSAVESDGLIFMEHNNEHLSFGAVTAFNYCLTALPAACLTLVLNRLAWRAFAQLHGTLAISGYICADPEAPTDATRYPAPDFFARLMARHTWLWFHATRATLAALLRIRAGEEEEKTSTTAGTMPAIAPADLTAALQVPPETWQRWAAATRFDAPPDVSRRRRTFLQMLDSCRVHNGDDEALLVLQHGRLAAAQAAAIQQHVEKQRVEKGAHHTLAPSNVTSVGYAVQLLYEVSRTLDVVFQKQRDGFCHRCHTIALEREQRAGGEAEEAMLEGRVASEAVAADLQPDAERSTEIGDVDPSLPTLPVLPPSQSPIDVLDYNLLTPAIHATTFSNHLPHLFATVLTAWVIEQRRTGEAPQQQQQQQQRRASQPTQASTRVSGLYDDNGTATAAAARRLDRPLHTLLDCFFNFRARVVPHASHDRLTFCQQLLDALVMPHVLIGQVFDGLWRRDSYGVSAAANMYLGFSRSVAAELDILMLQVLTMELAPADMAIHILRRFTYAKMSARARKKAELALALGNVRRGSTASCRTRLLAFRKYLKGYKYFLRLMLTLVVDTAKSSFHPPLSAHCIEGTVAHYLAQKRASHSTLIQVVSDSVRGGDFGTAEEDEKDASGNVIRFTQVIDAAIKKLAVAHDSSRGKQFQIRDAQTWKAFVNLYQSSILDSQLEEVHKNYRSVALASRSAKQAAKNEEEGEGENEGEGSGNTNRIPLPPTQLCDDAMYAELLPTTRALLHTDAVLLPALYILHEYANAHVPPPAPSSGKTSAAAAVGSPLTCAEEDMRSPRSDVSGSPRDRDVAGLDSASQASTTGMEGEGSDSDDSDDDDEDTNLITREALLHAVTTLYLCVRDCQSITRAMKAVEAKAGGDEAASLPAAASSSISWDLVELYLQRYRVNELSFTPASCARVLPLPELTRHRTLQHKLRTPVTLHCPATAISKAFNASVSSADMLHRLRTHLQSNKESDIYSCLEMVEETLVLTGLATFDTAAATAEQKAKEEAAQNRKKLIQERQAKLMQRMRSRVLKTAVDKEDPPGATGGTTVPHSPQNPSSPSAKTGAGNASGSLLTKVLLELATLDCCVCRSTTEEPLFLLCHTGTSAVLPQLGALVLPDERGVHNHLSICGHAAHKSCVEKLFIRLSVLWQRWNFRSQLFLGPTEFNCPLCNMIVTTLAPVPALPTGVMSPSSPGVVAGGGGSGASLFEELQTATVSPPTGNGARNAKDRTADVVMEFQTNLANSAVGFSPSEDITPLVSTEDALQKDNEAAWIMSETIRTYFYSSHLALEGVKAGRPISHRVLISLLSLLVSLVPAKLQAAAEALRTNFERTQRDGDSLLLLRALLEPREAAHLIRDHVLAHLLPSMPRDYLRRLLAAAADLERAASALEADFPEATMVVWKTTGVLALLKALLVEDASHAIILSSESFTVAGTVEFTTLDVQSIQTCAARCTAVLRMLQYLLPVPHKGATEKLAVVAQDVLACVGSVSTVSATSSALSTLPALSYSTAAAYVEDIAERVLHLPRVYATILTKYAENKMCSVCHQEVTNPVRCCRCGEHMCLRRQRGGAQPELYKHVRSCGGAVGMFLAVCEGNFCVMELTSGRIYIVASNYTDEYGERDRSLRRGVPLFRDREETQNLVETWMQNRWGAVSAIFTSSNRVDLTEL